MRGCFNLRTANWLAIGDQCEDFQLAASKFDSAVWTEPFAEPAGNLWIEPHPPSAVAPFDQAWPTLPLVLGVEAADDLSKADLIARRIVRMQQYSRHGPAAEEQHRFHHGIDRRLFRGHS